MKRQCLSINPNVLHLFFRHIRIKDWWLYVIPPVLSFYNIGLLFSGTKAIAFVHLLQDYVLFIALTAFTSALGFYLNEWSDIRYDKIGNKFNSLEQTSLLTKMFLLLVLCLGIAIISYFLKWNTAILILYIVQLLLFFLYSVPPFRFKRYTYVAIILDAFYSGTLFYFLAILYSTDIAVLSPLFLVSVCIWGFLRGVRNIIFHVLKDKIHDALSGNKTIAARNNTDNILQWVRNYIIPLEILFFVMLLSYLPLPFFTIVFYLLFMLYLYKRKEYIIPFIYKRKNEIETNVLVDMNPFYEILFPILTWFLLICFDVRLLFLLALSLILFPTVLAWIKSFIMTVRHF